MSGANEIVFTVIEYPFPGACSSSADIVLHSRMRRDAVGGEWRRRSSSSNRAEGKQQVHRIARLSQLVVILLLLTLLGTALVPLGERSPNVDPTSNASFRTVLLPRLKALTDSVDEVESLVSSRSRNIIALQALATRIETLITEIDAWLTSPHYSGDYPHVVEQYELGRDAVLTVIGEAQSAMRSFEFDSISELVPRFAIGAEHLREAVWLLETAEPAGSS